MTDNMKNNIFRKFNDLVLGKKENDPNVDLPIKLVKLQIFYFIV